MSGWLLQHHTKLCCSGFVQWTEINVWSKADFCQISQTNVILTHLGVRMSQNLSHPMRQAQQELVLFVILVQQHVNNWYGNISMFWHKKQRDNRNLNFVQADKEEHTVQLIEDYKQLKGWSGLQSDITECTKEEKIMTQLEDLWKFKCNFCVIFI